MAKTQLAWARLKMVRSTSILNYNYFDIAQIIFLKNLKIICDME
jgi:hypothetical protein